MTAETKRQGLPPPLIFKYLMNPAMKALLHSPFHGILSKNLAIIRFKGRKSGKSFSTPVAYSRLDEKTILVMTRSPWWKNLSNGQTAQLRLEGREYSAVPEIIQDNAIVWDNYISPLLQANPDPRRVGIMVGEDATPQEIREAASDLLAIRFTIK